MERAIGIDLGGTFIKAGLIDAVTGEILERVTVPTRDGERAAGGEPAFVGGVRGCVEVLEAKSGAAGLRVGLSAPGLAAADGSGILWMPGRMEGIERLDWSAALGRPVRVLNDAQAALLGEVWTGAGRGCRNVMMLTLGTGVGGASMVDGRLLRGHLGRAGHLGHVSVDADGALDAFNTPGSLEQAMGNLTIRERTAGRFDTTLALVAAVRMGDAEARVWWRESVWRLAVAVASLINVLDPERVIVGGGVTSGAGALLFDPLRRFMDDYEWRPAGGAVPMVAAEAGEWAGVVGGGMTNDE